MHPPFIQEFGSGQTESNSSTSIRRARLQDFRTMRKYLRSLPANDLDERFAERVVRKLQMTPPIAAGEDSTKNTL